METKDVMGKIPLPILKLRDEIDEKMRGNPPNMAIGKIVTHPYGYKVKIIDGCWRDFTHNGISNWWEWRRVLKDGKLSKTVESGYGWRKKE